MKRVINSQNMAKAPAELSHRYQIYIMRFRANVVTPQLQPQPPSSLLRALALHPPPPPTHCFFRPPGEGERAALPFASFSSGCTSLYRAAVSVAMCEPVPAPAFSPRWMCMHAFQTKQMRCTSIPLKTQNAAGIM